MGVSALMPIKRADKKRAVFMWAWEREKKQSWRLGRRSQRVRESVHVDSLRYTSIYSKLRAARRENAFVTFLFMPLRSTRHEWQTHGRGRGVMASGCGGMFICFTLFLMVAAVMKCWFNVLEHKKMRERLVKRWLEWAEEEKRKQSGRDSSGCHIPYGLRRNGPLWS